jgi:hypothetical protein
LSSVFALASRLQDRQWWAKMPNNPVINARLFMAVPP